MDPDDENDRMQWLGAGWLAWAIVMVLLILILGAGPALAQQEPKGVMMDCRQLAELVQSSASYRDTGADVKRFTAWLEKVGANLPEPQRAVVRREIARLWRERRPADEAAFAVFQRCQAQLGDMGRDS